MTRIIKADAIPDVPNAKTAVLNLADFAAEARSIVLEARKEAARIGAQAKAEADATERQVRQRGYADGFASSQNDGYAEGRRQARNEARAKFAQEYAELLDLAGRVVDELSTARAETLQRASEEILQMAVMLAERIVTRVAVADIEAAKGNLVKALELAHLGCELEVKVNPDQLAALQEHMPQIVRAVGGTEAVRLTGDAGISPGGVKAFTRHGTIDATVEKQLANAARALLGRDADADTPHEGRYEAVDCPPAGEAQWTVEETAQTDGSV